MGWAGGVVSGTVAEGSGAGVCGGAVFGVVIGVCGTPEPGLGVAGFDCDHPPTADASRKTAARKGLGKRCIEFRKLLRFEHSLGCRQQQLRWQATLNLAAQPEGLFRHPTDKQSYCPAALRVKAA